MHLEELRAKGVVTLSEPSLMAYLGGLPEFLVSRLRRLEHPHFRMIEAFVRHPASGTELLIVDRLTAGEDPRHGEALALFQQDHAGPLAELAGEHLTADGEHFVAAFSALYPDPDGGEAEVTYRMLGGEEFHGIRDPDETGRPLSQALYGTDDDEEFTLALVEWEGDWITAWFGKPLRTDQVTPL